MAHKKAGGSTRNGRDSESKRLGVKALTPRRLLSLSRPLRVLPPAFLCAIRLLPDYPLIPVIFTSVYHWR